MLINTFGAVIVQVLETKLRLRHFFRNFIHSTLVVKKKNGLFPSSFGKGSLVKEH